MTMRRIDSAHMLSSPSSTTGGVSPNGSPDTKLTAFSPEDTRSKGRSESNVGGSMNENGFRKFFPIPSADPFLVPAGPSNRGQLSPTAASFTPIGMAGRVANAGQAQSMARDGSGASFSTGNPNVEAPGLGSGSLKFSERAPDFGPVGGTPTLGSGGSGLARRTLERSPFHERVAPEKRTRSFVIENVPANISYMSLAGFFNRREFGTLKGPVLNELSSMGKVYAAFTDSREAKNAMDKIRLLQPEWRVYPLSAREYMQHVEPSQLSQTSDYEGQLVVSVFYDSRNPNFDKYTVRRSLETLAVTFGDLKFCHPLGSKQDHVSEFHLEFYDTRHAENALTTLNGATVDDCVLEVTAFKPDVFNRDSEDKPFIALPSSEDKPYLALPSSSTPVKSGGPRFETPYRRNDSWGPPTRTPYMELSPTGRSTVPSGENAGLIDWMSRAGERVYSTPRHSNEITIHRSERSNNQNAVDIERIRMGLDVRTTIMLRNIPNKIDQTMLKAIVDETSHGKYDFMYLRIDFANNCNVGYAFVNFEDPIDIIDFIHARAGRTWNCFNSDKVAEVSYATIQGKDCLIQKFRNSSVMLEHPSFRPKIFHTGSGPMAGTEDHFPGPDNPSKMRRSIENAEHVGLFAPRVGQQYRDEQRRRRSQFDRGTTAAEREVVLVRTITPRSFSGNGLRSAPVTYPGMRMYSYDHTLNDRGPRTS